MLCAHLFTFSLSLLRLFHRWPRFRCRGDECVCLGLSKPRALRALVVLLCPVPAGDSLAEYWVFSKCLN